MKSFYVLWNPRSNLPPRVQFDTEYEAQEVAAVMARKNDEPFYVMRAVSLSEVAETPVKVTKLGSR